MEALVPVKNNAENQRFKVLEDRNCILEVFKARESALFRLSVDHNSFISHPEHRVSIKGAAERSFCGGLDDWTSSTAPGLHLPGCLN